VQTRGSAKNGTKIFKVTPTSLQIGTVADVLIPMKLPCKDKLTCITTLRLSEHMHSFTATKSNRPTKALESAVGPIPRGKR
jgi:hypothetical protein